MKIRNSLFDADNWREIGATLGRNKTRTFLTAFGIFWGTAMLAMLFGGSKGLEDILLRNFDGFATNSAILVGARTTMPYGGYNKGTAVELTTADIDNILRTVPEIEALTSTASKTGIASRNNKSASTTAECVDENYTSAFLPILYEGRFINAADMKLERKVCVIGKQVAAELFGAESPIGKDIKFHDITYTVVGVAGQTSDISMGSKIDESILVPSTLGRRAFNLGDNVGASMIVARDGVSPTSLLPRIEQAVRMRHPIHPDDHSALFFFDVSEKFDMVDKLFLGVTLLALFVGVGTLMAGVIGVGNIMWVIVKERTQEIGIRRAIGATPADIITQILSEGIAMTTVAGGLGITFATIVLAVAQRLTANEVSTPQFQLSFGNAMAIVVAFMALGTLAGLIPSLKAMKIKPIEAINDK